MKRALTLSVLLVGFLSLSIVKSSYAQTEGTLEGVVTDPQGAIVQQTRVFVDCWGTDNLHRPVIKSEKLTYTDSKGLYVLHLTPGVCDVLFSNSLFTPIGTRIRIEAGAKASLSPQLKLDPLLKLIP